MELTYVTSILGCIVFNVVALGYHAIDGSMSAYTAPLVKPGYWMALIYLGILSTLVTSLLSSFALKWIEASKMSVIGNLSTLISMIAGAYILKEQLAYYHIVGAVMIIIGVLGTNFGGEKTSRRSKQLRQNHKKRAKNKHYIACKKRNLPAAQFQPGDFFFHFLVFVGLNRVRHDTH